MTALDTRPAIDRLPTAAWAMAWLFLAGQVCALVVRGPSSSGAPWILASIALTVVVVRWVADGVLRGRTVRLVAVWVLISAAASVQLVDLLIGPADVERVLSLGFSAAQLAALAAYCSTGYFQACRAGRAAPRSVLAPLLLIAVASGFLGGLTEPAAPVSSSTVLRVGL
ncbi:hypothetical protein [Nocardioides sp. YIM 152588]|uniref:hypothetical protein n=1 Tax=Nocardioides sp. YIM 152588 TaxID=3158259 RepID=UPI0032E4A424